MKLQGIRKVYHNKSGIVEALKGINLDISTVGITVLLGSSGCGKTSLLNILAGIDKDYEGIIEEMPDFYYLTQEFELMEAMSVLDNLLMVEDNTEKCIQLIEEYGLTEQINKKVSTLSNGQKKRVQFMKAILMNPSLLLCDEITAALDHENAELMMEKLKEYSKENQVLLVTHDIALAEKYADRIIKINRGIIESDEIIHNRKELETKKEEKSKTNRETIRLSAKRIRSRKFYSLLHVGILLLCIGTAFIATNLFTVIREQNDILNIFKSGTNMLVSAPHTKNKPIPGSATAENGYIGAERYDITSTVCYTYVYRDFNIYNYTDLISVMEENPEIMAVEAFYSMPYQILRYRYDYFVYEDLIERLYACMSEEYIDSLDMSSSKIHYVPFLKNNHGYYAELDIPFFLERELTKTNYAELSFYPLYDMEHYFGLAYSFRMSNQVRIYTLVNRGAELIPILYGELPQSGDEIMLDKRTAAKWAEFRGKESLEELIGEDFIVTIANSSYFDTTCHQFTFKITGITATENDTVQMAFLNNEFGYDEILTFYFDDIENIFFEYVNFLVEPGSDAEEVCKSVNDYFFFHDHNSFVRNLGKELAGSRDEYKDPKSYMTVCMIAVGAMIFLMILETLFESKRIRKEKRVIQSCGYASGKELIYRNGIYLLGIIVILLVILPIIINKVNEAAKTMQYAQFMEYDPILIIGVSFLVVLFSIILEKFATRKA